MREILKKNTNNEIKEDKKKTYEKRQ